MKLRVIIILISIFFLYELRSQTADSLYIPAKIITKVDAKLPDDYPNLDNAYVSCKIEIRPDSSLVIKEVIRSSHDGLLENAKKALQQWVVQPATLNGTPQSAELMTNINFEKPIVRSSLFADTSDSTKFVLDSLKYYQRMNLYAENSQLFKNKDRLNPFIFSEHYHLHSSPLLKFHIIDDNHLILPIWDTNANTLQKYLPFNNISSENMIYYSESNEEYYLPTLTQVELGTGDYDMNFALVDYRKGHLFDKEPFFAQVVFYGANGYWFGHQEKHADFKLMTGYNLKRFSLSYQAYFFNQQLSSNKFYFDDNIQLQRDERIHQLSLKSDIAEFSSRYTKIYFDDESGSLSKDYFSFDITKQWQIESFDAKTSIELVNKTPLFKGRFSTNFWGQQQFNSFFISDDNFYLDAKIRSPHFNGFDIAVKANIDELNEEEIIVDSTINQVDISEYIGNISYSSDLLSIDFDGGISNLKTDILNETIPFIESILSANYHFLDYNLFWQNHNKTYLDKNKYSKFSQQYFTHYLTNKSRLTISRNLNFDNAISLSLEHHFLHLDTQTYDEMINILNFELLIKITNFFEIKGNAKNILSEEQLWANELNLLHYQVALQWIFLN